MFVSIHEDEKKELFKGVKNKSCGYRVCVKPHLFPVSPFHLDDKELSFRQFTAGVGWQN